MIAANGVTARYLRPENSLPSPSGPHGPRLGTHVELAGIMGSGCLMSQIQKRLDEFLIQGKRRDPCNSLTYPWR